MGFGVGLGLGLGLSLTPTTSGMQGRHRPNASRQMASQAGCGMDSARAEKPVRSHPSVIESPMKTSRVPWDRLAAATCVACSSCQRAVADASSSGRGCGHASDCEETRGRSHDQSSHVEALRVLDVTMRYRATAAAAISAA